MDHYTHYPSFSSALVGFSQEARKQGFQIGLQASQDTVVTALSGLWLDRDLFEYALAALYCHAEEERLPFEKLYNRFWRKRGSRLTDKRDYKNQKKVFKAAQSVAVMLGTGKSELEGETEETKNTSGANAKETAKKTDFSLLTQQQSQLLDEISEKLIREMSLRIKRKKKKSKKGYIDLASSIRNNLQNGGTIINLEHVKPKREKYRLLVLLDVSGSMDKYSFYLLKFLWSLRHHFKQFEAFTFSTQLMRITDYLADKEMAISLAMISQKATHWSSGTKIGACLQTFNDDFSKRYLNGNTMTIVLSDGLDTGEPEVLEAAIQQI
ncbi:MAG: VWA domain-containing protein, partial [Bacteroidota bacterium]